MASLAITTIVMQLWRMDPVVPFGYRSDALSNALVIKGIVENGSFFTNPALGAPLGQEL